METKYNKGPWKTEPIRGASPEGSQDLTDADGIMIGTIWSPGFQEDYNHKANAKLISAAPELLEACKMAFIEINKGTADILTANVLFDAIKKATE